MTKYSQLVAPQRSELASETLRGLGLFDVLVEVQVCGVCTSELHGWKDGVARFPVRMGHEPAGIVQAVGSSVSRFKPGDRVTGLIEHSFSEAMVTHQDNLLHIPDGIPTEFALGEPLACMINAQRRTQVDLADRVAIIGLGFMGLGLLQLLRLRGPRQIIAVEVRDEARERALRLGATEAYHPQDLPRDYLLTDWSEWRGPTGVDVVIEASGTAPGLRLAGQMVRAHGILSIYGFHQGGAREVDVEMWNWKAIDVVNAHVRRQADLMDCMRRGLDLMAAGVIDFQSLITHRYPLSEIDKAFSEMATKPSGFIKAIVLPQP